MAYHPAPSFMTLISLSTTPRSTLNKSKLQITTRVTVSDERCSDRIRAGDTRVRYRRRLGVGKKGQWRIVEGRTKKEQIVSKGDKEDGFSTQTG